MAALVAIAVVTLAVTAAALVTPLDRRLRDDALRSLTANVDALRPALRRALADRSPGSDLRKLSRSLRRRTAAEVVVINSSGKIVFATDADTTERFPSGERAIAQDKLQRRTMDSGDGLEAQIAVPVSADTGRFALVATRSLHEASAATAVVRRALVVAALIGLGTAALLGFALATRLVRRLGTVRDTALRVAELGPGVEIQPDPGRDEIGDLSRAFATMQEHLREQEQARKTFVETASHELRTPLGSLRLLLEGLREDLDADPPELAGARDQAERAEGQSGRLAALADELLTLSRIDAGTPIRRELVDLGELIRSVIAEFEPRAREQRVTTRLEGASGIWAVGDPGAVARILRIVLDNGLGFSPPDAAITVSVSTAEGEVEIAITDAGPGVPSADATRIFDRFTRGSVTGPSAGFGLGLAIGRQLAERMGGRLVLAQSKPGSGARFMLYLPEAPAP